MTNLCVCWKCGAALKDVPLPLGRLAECPTCRTELHVCVSCIFYDTSVAKHCREPIAEEVKDKTRANFCDYFELRPDAYQPPDDSAARAARSELDALFGGRSRTTAESSAESSERKASEEAQRARDALDALFKARKEH